MKKHLIILTFITILLAGCRSNEPAITMDQENSYIKYWPDREELEMSVRYLSESDQPVDFCVELLFEHEDLWDAFPYERYLVACSAEGASGETSGELTFLSDNKFTASEDISLQSGIDEAVLPGNVSVRFYNTDGEELIEPLEVLE
ncbi:hypothetical protein [Jeotgalibacillus terrae]|uniref:DUF5067 domain-containing protein n=1 Tax=Jeotgalibacillus terrae TaxID=587735 RepID=A0ABW5ZPF8_9BACL|nr:hypothetical protein [Jeotgalibacillus terrae]MBM7581130.1 hypothetical protein [Jeotgalibacillus terrae]